MCGHLNFIEKEVQQTFGKNLNVCQSLTMFWEKKNYRTNLKNPPHPPHPASKPNKCAGEHQIMTSKFFFPVEFNLTALAGVF